MFFDSLILAADGTVTICVLCDDKRSYHTLERHFDTYIEGIWYKLHDAVRILASNFPAQYHCELDVDYDDHARITGIKLKRV